MSKPSTPNTSPKAKNSIILPPIIASNIDHHHIQNLGQNQNDIGKEEFANKNKLSYQQQQQPLLKPSTPSPPRHNRVSASFTKTPEQSKEPGSKRNSFQLAYTPSYKRTSTGSLKSPDGKLVYRNVNSPYSAAQLLKTPKHSLNNANNSLDDDDSIEDENEDGRKVKMMKTPQYHTTAKKLFQNDETPTNSITTPAGRRESLSEISSQLKSRLTSALGKLQKEESANTPHKITFTELSFDSQTSPTKKYNPKTNMRLANNWVPTNTLNRANLNLQTLQQSPLPNYSSSSTTTSPNIDAGGFRSNTGSPLKHSPLLKDQSAFSRLNDMPSPEEDSSAQSALLAALSRSKKRHSIPKLEPSSNLQINTGANLLHKQEIRLPPIRPRGSFENKNNEKDAVFSLMALSSPQSIGSRRGMVFPTDETDEEEEEEEEEERLKHDGNVSDETVDEE
ncbi:uncharacterized protein LODBEIA_P09880 [Lodderomyces beijingensis]|uniref:Uncharacterized protein n=1 Tax=Lodderomyces beijingensis TaxID=1775926 RepID=A0ABP0ZF24_9ASCO